MIQITSDTRIPISQHFRVSAGPGAGKTHWLIEHIKNILSHSDKLRISRKIAGITYTNVAVETILERLGTATNHLEVSTIHSFLYKHVVRPYSSFLVDDYGLSINDMDGHDDTILSNYSFLHEWKEKTKQLRITDDNTIVKAFEDMRWRFDIAGNLVVKTDFPHKFESYAIKTDSYYEYKKMAWSKGVIHHDDVLFFSFQLIMKYPFIIKVLRAMFPYILIDEFQDTNPIQAEILKQIGQEETTVGVIGDRAQSIYKFQGADPAQFLSFQLPNMVDYEMSDNRRSTNQIIDLLNTIRSNICQNKYRNVNGDKPTLLVGDMVSALSRAKDLCNSDNVYTLSRDNLTSNAMKRELSGVNFNNNLLEELSEKDKPSSGNKYRSKVIISCLKAVEYAREKKFNDAMKELARINQHEIAKDLGRKMALKSLCCLLEHYHDYKDETMFAFFDLVKNLIKPDISRLTNGAAKSFYDSHSYLQLALCVRISEDVSKNRTIHKAKGDEFENVLMILKDEKDLAFLLNPNLESEEHRIYYVAASRAINRLYINVPQLNTSSIINLQNKVDLCHCE